MIFFFCALRTTAEETTDWQSHTPVETLAATAPMTAATNCAVSDAASFHNFAGGE